MSRWTRPQAWGVGQSQCDLPAHARRLGGRRIASLFQPFVQRQALEKLHRQENDLAFFADVMDGDDVIAFELGGGAGLAQKAFAVGGVLGHFRAHDLQGDGTLQMHILGVVDHAHAAGAQHLEDAITAEPADLIGSLRRSEY